MSTNIPGQPLTVPTAKSLNFWPRTGCNFTNGLCSNTGQDCCDTGGCTSGGDCASGICNNSVCQSSGVDSIATFCNTTYASSISCKSNASCPALVGYQPASCSGCPTDSKNPLSTSWPKTATACNGNNPNWVSAAMGELKTAKVACPTAYSFPFDDPTSTFQCSSGQTNSVSYTITFCP